MPVKGSAELTGHLSVAVSPDMKIQVETAARQYGVKPAVIVRWAIEEYFSHHVKEGEEQ